MDICLFEDGFLEDKSIWVAKLSDGSTVFQDDDRPGKDCRIAWHRLRNYLYFNDLDIIELYIKFRDHYELAGRNTEGDGFFFSNCIIALLSSSSQQINCSITGMVQKDTIFCTRWKLPEVLKMESFTKVTKDNHDRIIWNSNTNAGKSNRKIALSV